jgi:hypothetical protein
VENKTNDVLHGSLTWVHDAGSLLQQLAQTEAIPLQLGISVQLRPAIGEERKHIKMPINLMQEWTEKRRLKLVSH